MSSAYRYVVFAPGVQPTVTEVDQLKVWSQTTHERYAVGISAEDGALVLAFQTRVFESARSAHGRFDQLIERWEVRGSQVRERLKFIKQPTALQPSPGDTIHDAVAWRRDRSLQQKQWAAQEALGRAGLRLHQTLQRHEWLARMAKTVPYTLIGLIGVLMILAGVYTGQRLLEAPNERRQQTIERISADTMAERLAVETSGD